MFSFISPSLGVSLRTASNASLNLTAHEIDSIGPLIAVRSPPKILFDFDKSKLYARSTGRALSQRRAENKWLQTITKANTPGCHLGLKYF